jgi:PAS domain S-box-containing protein
MAQAVMTDDSLVLTSQKTRTYEETLTLPSGERREFLTTKGPLLDGNGVLLGVFGVSRDITERKQALARLQQFVSQSPFAVCMLDTDMVYLNASKKWHLDYGLKTEILGKSHYEVFPEIPDHWKAIHRRCLAGAIESKDEEPFRRLDGSVSWVRWEVRPWYEVSGTIGGILIFSEDISARKLLEQKLLEKQQYLLDSQEVARVGTWMLDLPSFGLSWTEQTYRNFGVSAEAFPLSIESVYALIHPEHRAAVRNWFRATMANETPGAIEFRIVRPDGTTREVEGRGRVTCDEENRPVRIIGTNLDITERKQAERKLACSERRLNTIISSVPECVHILGAAGEVLQMNPAGLAQLEVTSIEELESYSLIDFVCPEYRKSFLALHKRVMDGENGKLEFEATGLRGTRRWLETHATPLRSADGVEVMLLGVTRDITDQKRIEKELFAAKCGAEEVSRNRSAFLDVAAHELRNPVTAISLLLQVAQRRGRQGLSIDLDTLSGLQEPVDRLARLVFDLLDISRLERGLVDLQVVRSDILSLVSRCVEEFRLKGAGRRIALTEPAQTVEIELDPVRIFQVLSNLMDNALKYTPQDSPIEVTVEPKLKVIRVSVIDHGAGIAQQQLSKLFSAFSRGSSDATHRISGLGLGLSICRNIVELHGGSIGVSSEVGLGSTFYFELPRSATE